MNWEIRNGLILTALASSLGAAEPKTEITVMVYNYAAIPADVLAQTKREAARIYGHAGIAIEWLDCALSPKEAALFPACRIEVGPAKLAVRLVPQARAGHLPHVEDSLGFAMMPRDGNFAAIANIFADETERLCKRFNWESGANLQPGTLLGVVVAHELGHLLLGGGGHAHVGIMRAHWQRKDLKLIVEGVMTFTPSEAESLRTSVRARMAAQAPGVGKGYGQGSGTIGTDAAATVTGYYATSDTYLHRYVRVAIITSDAPRADTSSGQGTIPQGINSAGAITAYDIDANGANHGSCEFPDTASISRQLCSKHFRRPYETSQFVYLSSRNAVPLGRM